MLYTGETYVFVSEEDYKDGNAVHNAGSCYYDTEEEAIAYVARAQATNESIGLINADFVILQGETREDIERQRDILPRYKRMSL